MAAKPDSNGSTGRQHVPLNVGKVVSRVICLGSVRGLYYVCFTNAFQENDE